MVSYLPGAGKRSLPESRERPFPKARRYGREKYMGARSGSGCRTNAGELFRAGRGTGGFGEQPKPRVTARTDVFRLSFRPDVRLRPCVPHGVVGNGRRDGTARAPRFKRKTVKSLSPTLGITGKSPQHSEDLQRKARPEGERPNNHPTKLLLSIP
ncbi:hypothetical protein NXW76_20625 [Bacteroides thetaiotaomicron]|nr:hypothetical protein [Bacteroides thetaiotaomicron]